MLLELREKMVEDRIYTNAKFGDMQGAQGFFWMKSDSYEIRTKLWS